MGQFKPMVKMMTTEPSIELKLKKGGHVAMPKMKSKDNGTGSKKMADGGMSGVLSRAGLPPGPVGGASPAAPSMSARRKAMMGRKKADGGEALKKHADMPASKAHKGLKTGGVAMGQGGYKNGGSVIPVSASKRGAGKYEETLMHTATPDRSPAKTGDVKMGNGGGYKKGGKIKKMALGGTTGMVKGLMGNIKTPAPAGTYPTSPRPSIPPRDIGTGTGPRPTITPRPPIRRGSGPNDAGPGRMPVKKMAMGGLNNVVKGAMNRVTSPSKPAGTSLPRPPVRRGSGPNDAGPMGPRGPKNPGPMPKPRGGTYADPKPSVMPRPVRDIGYGNGRMPTEQDWKNHAATAKYGSQAAMDAAKNDFMSKPLRNPRGFAKGGGVEGNVSSSRPGVTNTTTGEVRKGNAGGFKKGGALKKFARGGSVNDSGKAVAMPQGYKKPPTPVSINQLSGTYKKGGKVRKYAEGGMSDKEQAKAYDRFYADETAQNKAEREAFIEAMKNPLDAMRGLPERLRKGYEAISKGLKGSGSVTTTEREVSRTVTPAKKRSGGAC